MRGLLGQQGLPACMDAGEKAATAGQGAVAVVQAGAYTTPFAVGPSSSKEPSIEQATIKAAVLFRPGSPITIGRCGSLQSPTHGSSRVAAAANHAGTPGEQHGDACYPPQVGVNIRLSRIEGAVNHDPQQDCNNGTTEHHCVQCCLAAMAAHSAAAISGTGGTGSQCPCSCGHQPHGQAGADFSRCCWACSGDTDDTLELLLSGVVWQL